ncbi:ribonuclease catalytic domain-containing protein [Desulfococcus sp.]|uniref:ribonuclease catalytic domain-containing protein n=1 Tax=Desulfococcus sp. TaxID=2025834 RepID=UPI0035934D40
MELGNIVEFIDRQKIVCAVVLEVGRQKLRLLAENSREIVMAEGRLLHKSNKRLDLSGGWERLAAGLKETARLRESLAGQVDIQELWEVLNTEQEWISLHTMTQLCFPDAADGDHESAVIRAFFRNRHYFKFNQEGFLPLSEAQMTQQRTQAEAAARRNRLIERGGEWLKRLMTGCGIGGGPSGLADEEAELIAILKSYYLFEKESIHAELGKAITARAGVGDLEKLFQVFVRLGIWDTNENIDLHRYDVPTDFSEEVMTLTRALLKSSVARSDHKRRDITDLRMITIDGQSTLDFDDALSIEDCGEYYLLGVHIADVGHFVADGCTIDREAVMRGSSIYMPDRRIPMLPPELAEGQCSLRVGEVRPGISTMIRLSRNADIESYEIFPSIVRVTDQLTYYDANVLAEGNKEIATLANIARKFRQRRLGEGAVHISLPEVNVWIDETGELIVNKTNRESPARLLVSEIMIMANWLVAEFLIKHGLPAIYRSQPNPRERLFKENGGTLYQNWMQRKFLSRFVLSPQPERHSGLGLNAYVTATSPIRKYFDLVTQRQIRSVYGLNSAYGSADIEKAIQLLEQPMSAVIRLQNRRKRYWLLKYLEKRIGQKEEAIVLNKRKGAYLALMTDYMIECVLPNSSGVNLKPEDLIQVTIQHVDARKDILTVYVG